LRHLWRHSQTGPEDATAAVQGGLLLLLRPRPPGGVQARPRSRSRSIRRRGRARADPATAHAQQPSGAIFHPHRGASRAGL